MPTAVLWKTRLGLPFSGTFLFLIDNRLVCLVGDSKRRALKAWTDQGKPAWSVPFESPDALAFFPYGADAYVDGRQAVRVRASDGEIVARRDLGETVHAYPPADDGPVYLTATRIQTKATLGLDADTLETRWELQRSVSMVHGRTACAYEPERGELEMIGLPALQRRVVPAPFEPGGDIDWHLHAAGVWCHFFERHRYGVDFAAGMLLWLHHEPEPGYHGVVTAAAGDRFYCGNHGVSCYEAATGTLVWRQSLPGTLLTSKFHISPDGIWAASRGRAMSLLATDDGRVLSSHELDDTPLAVAPLGDRRAAVATHGHLIGLQL